MIDAAYEGDATKVGRIVAPRLTIQATFNFKLRDARTLIQLACPSRSSL
jgi:hypothetical protein